MNWPPSKKRLSTINCNLFVMFDYFLVKLYVQISKWDENIVEFWDIS